MRLSKILFSLSCTPGILVLDNPRKKRALLVRTTDPLMTLSRIMKGIKSRNKQYRELRKDYRSLEIKLVDPDNSRMTYQYWTDKYLQDGYTLYSSYKAVQYTIKIEVDPEYYVVVKLRSRGRYEVILGLFDTVEAAEEFVEYAYPDKGKIYKLTYAQNELSKEFFKKSIP